MPVYGLPASLERILNPTISCESLKGWNLYKERDVSIKIKFTCSDSGDLDSQSIANHTTGTNSSEFRTNVFKRKSASTCARDKLRHDNWKTRSTTENSCKQGPVTHNQSKAKSSKAAATASDDDASSIESDRRGNCITDEFTDTFSPVSNLEIDLSENPSPDTFHTLNVPAISLDESHNPEDIVSQLQQPDSSRNSMDVLNDTEHTEGNTVDLQLRQFIREYSEHEKQMKDYVLKLPKLVNNT